MPYSEDGRLDEGKLSGSDIISCTLHCNIECSDALVLVTLDGFRVGGNIASRIILPIAAQGTNPPI